MLNKLLPEQVAKFWDIIKFAAEQSLPPTVVDSPDNMNRLLAAALSGAIAVWVTYEKKEVVVSLEGIVITNFLYDNVSDTRSLLIYSLYGYNSISSEGWREGFKGLAKYAKARGCNQIVAYTNSNAVIEAVKHLGGEASYTFVSFNLDKLLED